MRKTLTSTGWAVVAVGAVGLLSPTALGTHAGALHNLVHLAAGASAVRCARRASRRAARSFALLSGAAYLMAAAAGLAFGTPGSPAAAPDVLDPALFRLIPGWLELGRADHLLHLAAGLACALAAAGSRPDRPTPVRARERETVLH